MRIVVPFGFYGYGNIGDEATLAGFSQLLKLRGGNDRVHVASQNPAHTSRVQPSFSYVKAHGWNARRALAKLMAGAQIYAGGTPIMDGLGDWPLCEVVPLIRAARRLHTPIAFVGIGTETLNQAKSKDIVANEIAPYVRHWTVRCEHDRRRLLEYGVKAEAVSVAADMAWLIAPATKEFGVRRLHSWGIKDGPFVVGVNVVNEHSLLEKQPQIVAQLAAALDALVESKGAKILFLANEIRPDPTFDVAAAKMVLGQMKHSQEAIIAPADYLSPAEMMSIIGQCNLTMSMRYHFCLFSALQNVPFVALTRSDKVADLCWDLDWKAAIKPIELTTSKLLEQVDTALTTAADHLPSRVGLMGLRAHRNLAALDAVMGADSPQQASLASE